MASATFPEPIKGDANPSMVFGTPTDEAMGKTTQVTGVAITQRQGSCKRRCCIGTGITLALLAALGIGIAVGFFIFGDKDDDAVERDGRQGESYEKEYAPEMGGFFTLSVSNATRFLAQPEAWPALSSGIASLYDGLDAADVTIKELLHDSSEKESDGLGRRLQPMPSEDQYVHVLYTVRRRTVEQAQAVLEALKDLPLDTVKDKLRAAAQSFGVDGIDGVAEPRFCMVLKRHTTRGGNLRGGSDRERGDRERADRDRKPGKRDREGRDREDDDDRRLQEEEEEEHEEEDEKDHDEEDEEREHDLELDEMHRQFLEDCDWADHMEDRDYKGRNRWEKEEDEREKDEDERDDDDDEEDDED